MDEVVNITSGENKRVHLQMIQGVINRMGGNLFYLKGWAVALIIGVFATTVVLKGNLYMQIILVGTIIFFWFFDAYFLSLEHCFRYLYDDVRQKKEEKIDFSMSIDDAKKLNSNSIMTAFFSKTLVWFYLTTGVLMVLIVNLLS